KFCVYSSLGRTPMAVPSITIFVRHSADCSDRLEGEFHKRCNCRKHLRWFHNGKLYRQSAKTRSWAQAEAERRKLEARFEAANGAPVKPEQQTWKTVEIGRASCRERETI